MRLPGVRCHVYKYLRFPKNHRVQKQKRVSKVCPTQLSWAILLICPGKFQQLHKSHVAQSNGQLQAQWQETGPPTLHQSPTGQFTSFTVCQDQRVGSGTGDLYTCVSWGLSRGSGTGESSKTHSSPLAQMNTTGVSALMQSQSISNMRDHCPILTLLRSEIGKTYSRYIS